MHATFAKYNTRGRRSIKFSIIIFRFHSFEQSSWICIMCALSRRCMHIRKKENLYIVEQNRNSAFLNLHMYIDAMAGWSIKIRNTNKCQSSHYAYLRGLVFSKNNILLFRLQIISFQVQLFQPYSINPTNIFIRAICGKHISRADILSPLPSPTSTKPTALFKSVHANCICVFLSAAQLTLFNK